MKPNLRYSIPIVATFLVSACGAHNSADPSPHGPAEESESTASATPLDVDTEWLAIFVDGRKSGYLSAQRRVWTDRVETEVTTDMALRRGDDVVPIRTVSLMTETREGKPLRIVKRTEGAGMARVETGVLGDDGVLHFTTEADGRRATRTVEWPEGALMNEGQRLEVLRHGLKTGVSYTSTYFDPDLLEAVPVTVRVGERTEVDLLGRWVTGTIVELETVVRGVASTLHTVVDDEMRTLLVRSNQMGMTVEMIACTEAFARSDNDPAEVVSAAFVSSPVPLSPEKRQGPITYTLRLTGEARGLALIETDEQSVEKHNGDLRIRVEKGEPSRPEKMPYAGTNPDARAALVADSWVQSDAPEIIEAARIATNGATDAWTAARNIEAYVSSYIANKNFSVGYATALETLRSKQGDCTEHALLTAALCRAAGIPARVVFGLAYVPQCENRKDIFGGHAWTQVFVNDRWWSLDAAMGSFDTGHIALGVSGGDPADFFQVIGLIGNIEILEIR